MRLMSTSVRVAIIFGFLIIAVFLASNFNFLTLAASDNLLTSPWHFIGNNGAAENYQDIPANALNGYDTLQLNYDLHGLCLLDGDASAIIFEQPSGGSWHYVSLSNYGKNCYDGKQDIQIPLSKFSGLNTNYPVGEFHARIWSDHKFQVDIINVQLIKRGSLISVVTPSLTPIPSLVPTPTITPTLSPSTFPDSSPTPVAISLNNPMSTSSAHTWEIQSVSSMKETKDKICNQDNADFINKWLDKAQNLGVNYVALETPYDNPSCGSAINYTANWVKAIRAHGLNVWHRHMPLAFEGIYGVTKTKQDYLSQISAYIKAHPEFFADNDIFTPIPEPQNGGINGITYCAQNFCQFSGAFEFNSWLRQAMSETSNAFQSIGKRVKVGYFGFDGFVAWGDNNPDWHGILEDATITQMGNITIDHYPQLVGDTMQNDLNELQKRYPNVPIIIGEWGAVGASDPIKQVNDTMTAAKRSGVIGFNYWHEGMGGNESLINSDFTVKQDYATVQSFFRPK